MNQAKSPNRIVTLIVPIIAALTIATILAPVIADRLNLPRPSWLPNWTAQPETQTTKEGFSTDESHPASKDAIAEAWPTPPKDIMASSGNVTPISARATAIPAATRTPFPTPTQIALPTPAWRKMNYLTTVKFKASTIVEAERTTDISLMGEVLGDITTDRLLLKAVGEVSVGIDLSRISNVKIDGTTIHLKMPAVEVMAVEVLPKESQIYAKSSTIFLSQYEGLESDALDQARRQLRTEVIKNEGLMELTKKTSRLQLTEFLESVGYQNIEIK